MWAHGKFYWNELLTTDAAAAKAFFARSIGWTYHDMPMSEGLYNIIMQDGEPAGGIMQLTGEMASMPTQWMAYLAVDDIDARLALLVEAGGTVLRPAWDVPGVGRIAMVREPSGGVMGWMTPVTPTA